MASLVITRLDLPLALSTGPTEAAFVLRGGRGPRGFDGEDGADGPNLVSDATALGTLTQAGSPTFLLADNGVGTFVGKYAPGATGWQLLAAGTAAAARLTLGLGTLALVTPTGTPDGTKFLRDDGSWQTVAAGVTSFNTRTGAVVPASGDYTAAMVTNAAAVNAANTFTAGQTVAPTAGTGTQPPALTITGAAHTALTASTERHAILWNLSSTKQFAAGALATQREVRIQGPTYAFVGASTITTAATVEIETPTAGTNATITNPIALRLAATHAAGVPLDVTAFTGQTADLSRWRNAAGTLRSRFDLDGRLVLGTPGTTNQAMLTANAGGLTYAARFESGVIITASAGLELGASSATVQFSAGGIIRTVTNGLAFRNSGGVTVGTLPASGSGFGFAPSAAGEVGVIIQGLSSQTGNLAECRDNSSQLLARIGATGTAEFNVALSVMGGAGSSLRYHILDTNGHSGRSGQYIGWASGATDAGGGIDTGFRRAAAGIPCVYDGDLATDVALRFQRKSSTTNQRDVANIAASLTDTTDATRTGRLSLGAYYTTSLQTALTIDAQSSGTPKLTAGGAFTAVNGTAAAPGLNFVGGTTSGFYWGSVATRFGSANGVGLAFSSGNLIAAINNEFQVRFGNDTRGWRIDLSNRTINANADGTDAACVAGSARSSDASIKLVGETRYEFADWTAASFTGRTTLYAYETTNAQEGVRVEGNSGGVRLGFYGQAAVARQSGDVLTGLVNLGLFSSATLPNFAQLNAANTFTVGGQVIQTTGGAVGLNIQATSPSADVLRASIDGTARLWMTSAGVATVKPSSLSVVGYRVERSDSTSTVFSVDGEGKTFSNFLGVGSTPSTSYQALLVTDTTSRVVLRLQGAVSQTANLLELWGVSSTQQRVQGAITTGWAKSTDASREGYMSLGGYYLTNLQEGVRVAGNSGGANLGFFGVSPVAQQSLPGAGVVTAADIRTALINLGLCI